MSATTTTWAIPYATAADPLCNGDDIIEAMAERVDAILTGFDTDIELLTVRPYAQLALGAATVTTAIDQVDFDEVLADTANMTNLSLSDTTITISHDDFPGVYLSSWIGTGQDAAGTNVNTFEAFTSVITLDGYASVTNQGVALWQVAGNNSGQTASTFYATGLPSFGLPGAGTDDVQIRAWYELFGTVVPLTSPYTQFAVFRISYPF